MSIIIDRRLNDRKKSSVNRERFIRRYKSHIKHAVTDMVSERSIKDMDRGGDVKIPVKDIAEPTFRHGAGGDREAVHPGNHKFNPGDRIKRPQGGGEGDGSGDQGGEGDGEDGFTFTLSREEFMELFFDDLELPHLTRTQVGDIVEFKMQRAGYTRQGSPTNLSIARSLRNALGRRIALSSRPRRELQELTDRLTELEARGDDTSVLEEKAQLLESMELLRRQIGRVPFIDEIDLRFRHRVPVPKPISQAAMFCLMDVSASMDERKKDLAKRFFTLLYLFLSRKYQKVDVIFIRHTEEAEEVDEEHFFHDARTGGTVVFSALDLMRQIMTDRYPAGQWNLYGAQASDGDAFGADPDKSSDFLAEKILPDLRHFAYVEVPDSDSRPSRLAAAYRRIDCEHFAMRQVRERRDIYPVFRDLFSPEKA
ncbi:MAG: YeaH/YhbH family protein [Lautropia sp.]|nr:YeaH/YhbH family protein [Lautropia sp.]